jgi:hypothetical protein
MQKIISFQNKILKKFGDLVIADAWPDLQQNMPYVGNFS